MKGYANARSTELVNGCLINEQDQREAESMGRKKGVRSTERKGKSKRSNKERQRRRRKKAASMVWIYIWDQRRGEP